MHHKRYPLEPQLVARMYACANKYLRVVNQKFVYAHLVREYTRLLICLLHSQMRHLDPKGPSNPLAGQDVAETGHQSRISHCGY